MSDLPSRAYVLKEMRHRAERAEARATELSTANQNLHHVLDQYEKDIKQLQGKVDCSTAIEKGAVRALSTAAERIEQLEAVLQRIADSGIENNIAWAWIGGTAKQVLASAGDTDCKHFYVDGQQNGKRGKFCLHCSEPETVEDTAAPQWSKWPPSEQGWFWYRASAAQHPVPTFVEDCGGDRFRAVEIYEQLGVWVDDAGVEWWPARIVLPGDQG